jgi:PAS domain S-box-containing protein
MNTTKNYNRMLLENTVIGLVLCRMNGDLVDVNSAFSELLGKSIEETLTLTYWQITPKKYTDQENSLLDSLKKPEDMDLMKKSISMRTATLFLYSYRVRLWK